MTGLKLTLIAGNDVDLFTSGDPWSLKSLLRNGNTGRHNDLTCKFNLILKSFLSKPLPDTLICLQIYEFQFSRCHVD